MTAVLLADLSNVRMDHVRTIFYIPCSIFLCRMGCNGMIPLVCFSSLHLEYIYTLLYALTQRVGLHNGRKKWLCTPAISCTFTINRLVALSRG